MNEDENPEWTEADFARAKPFRDVFPDHFASCQKRPDLATSIELKLPGDIVRAIQAHGPESDGRVTGILRKALDAGEL